MNDSNPFAMTDKVVLVTGASSGIGQATAIACSHLGAKLIITGRDAVRLQATYDRLAGEGHAQVIADLTSDVDLQTLVAACPELNGIVLCAGINAPLPFALSTRNKFETAFDVNFFAPVELLRLLLKGKKIADAGSVVFVSSVAALPGGAAAGNAIYGASKAALDATMRHLVLEYGSHKIRFNSVNPGTVETPLARRIQEKLTSDQLAADIARYPLGRHGDPTDIANGIIYLLSGASSWVTGHQLVVDGGLTA